MNKDAEWVLNYLRSVEARGEHAPVETMERFIAHYEDVLDALTIALPFVEDCDSLGVYKAGVVDRLVRRMRNLIESDDKP